MNNYNCIPFSKDKQLANAFVAFSKKLYDKKNRTTNPGDELRLLNGTHALSSSFLLQPFLLMQNEQVIGRAAFSLHADNPTTAYLGFFELIDDDNAAAFFFSFLECWAKEKGFSRVVGPMNGSFWLGYRMKTNCFEEPPFFSEPHNRSYYQRLWENNGYLVTDRYVSNLYPVIKKDGYHNARYQKRLADFAAKGYTICSPKSDDWDTIIQEIYDLIIELYCSFPGFSSISKQQFIQNYSGLKYILDFSFCLIAYHKGKAVGFSITVPDYGTLLNQSLNPLLILQMLHKRKHCKRYVILYLGVAPQHKGLGTAMVQLLIEKLREKKAAAIGALIHEGKVTGGYAHDFIQEQHHYVLFEKKL